MLNTLTAMHNHNVTSKNWGYMATCSQHPAHGHTQVIGSPWRLHTEFVMCLQYKMAHLVLQAIYCIMDWEWGNGLSIHPSWCQQVKVVMPKRDTTSCYWSMLCTVYKGWNTCALTSLLCEVRDCVYIPLSSMGSCTDRNGVWNIGLWRK